MDFEASEPKTGPVKGGLRGDSGGPRVKHGGYQSHSV